MLARRQERLHFQRKVHGTKPPGVIDHSAWPDCYKTMAQVSAKKTNRLAHPSVRIKGIDLANCWLQSFHSALPHAH